MVALSFAISAFNGFNGNEGMFFLRCVLLLSSIIPISLRVNLDLAKLYYSYRINSDEEIQGTMARNSNIPEDLGRLSYLITDKTGTLTQNEMLLKKVCTEAAIFETDDPNQTLENILRENCEQNPQGPCNDGAGGSQAAAPKDGAKKKSKRDQGHNLRDLMTAFAICNNVTPVLDDPDIDKALDVKEPEERMTEQPKTKLRGFGGGSPNSLDMERKSHLPDRIPKRTQIDHGASKVIFQGSSPDEVALVKYAFEAKLELIERDRTTV